MIGAASPTVVNAIQCYTLHGKESSKRGDRGREWQSVAWMNKPWAAAAAMPLISLEGLATGLGNIYV